jgi:GMP synthase-like glutamine amidotransferase
MGGPMDVWEEGAHPWLVAEKRAIRTWVERDRPFLGFCLGHQLLADALGGTVGPASAPEVGIMNVALTETGVEEPLFAGLPHDFTCMQWHSAAVLELPANCAVLARSTVCPVQAIKVGSAAFGLQFHIEVTDATAGEWGCVPAYAESLEVVMGAGAADRLEADMAAALPGLNLTARTLYDNFMALVRAP